MIRPLPPIITLRELQAKPLKEPEVLIDGFLERGDKAIIFSSSKGNKSWCMMHLALVLAQGLPSWLDMKVQKPRKVLYLNFELPEFHFRARLRDIAGALKVNLDCDELHVWNLRGHSRTYAELSAQIRTQLATAKYDVIVIDPLYKFNSSDRSENSAEDMAIVMNAIEGIAVELDAAIIIIHHSPKGDMTKRTMIDRASGSGVLARDPDVIVDIRCLSEEEETFEASFKFRSKPPRLPMGLRWTYPLMKLDATVTEVDAKVSKGAKELLSLLPASGYSSKDWQTAAEEKLGISRSTFNRQKGDLHYANLVEVEDSRWIPMTTGRVGSNPVSLNETKTRNPLISKEL